MKGHYGRLYRKGNKEEKEKEKPESQAILILQEVKVGKGEFTKLSVMLHRNAHYSQK